MTRVPLSELPSTIRQQPSALCKSLSDELSERRASVSKALASSVKHEGDAISRISCPRSFSVVPQSCPWSCFAYGALFCEPSEAYVGRCGRFWDRARCSRAAWYPKAAVHRIRPWGQSKTRQTLRAVVGDGNTGDLFSRSV